MRSNATQKNIQSTTKKNQTSGNCEQIWGVKNYIKNIHKNTSKDIYKFQNQPGTTFFKIKGLRLGNSTPEFEGERKAEARRSRPVKSWTYQKVVRETKKKTEKANLSNRKKSFDTSK